MNNNEFDENLAVLNSSRQVIDDGTNEKIRQMEMKFEENCWILLLTFILVRWNLSDAQRMKAIFEYLHVHKPRIPIISTVTG